MNTHSEIAQLQSCAEVLQQLGVALKLGKLLGAQGPQAMQSHIEKIEQRRTEIGFLRFSRQIL